MKEKVLMLASVASMIDQFNIPNIKLLQNMGYEVHVACNFEKGSSCSNERVQTLKKILEELKVKYYQIDFERNILKIINNIKAYKQVKKILLENKYKFLHCHSPIGGVVGRLAGYKTQTKVIYTAHGFHFFKGAPLINWLLYYPIEKYLSKYTDVLITINKEDYKRAKTFHAKKVEYIPGVGIDVEKIRSIKVDKEAKRKELGLTKENIVLLSVGELNKNKNHSIVIKALAKINNPNIYYLICGQGKLKEELIKLAKDLKIEKNVKLLGFRKDVYEIYKISDIFIFPSKREGLSVALMEAICCDLPIICSNIRGNNDLVENGKNGFLVKVIEKNEYIEKIKLSKNLEKSTEKILAKINIQNIEQKMITIYAEFVEKI
ncbi:glycosyltransferase family 4 protein [Fusobacterium sp. SYSU M8D902]|uniref:glycosyltransferase family 4 protein n=1 Tax=Fusobacterium sp. SYSU M8D902 TaxID=3159562 RepID=UPI0032E40F85